MTQVRLAKFSDASIIARCNAQMALETEGIQLNLERLQKGVEALFHDASKGLYYVAEMNNTVVGQLMITYEWSDWRNATFWWIQSVYVLPEYRNQGIFRALYRHVESLAKTRGDVCGLRLYVEKGNARARHAYETLGMTHSHYEMMEMEISS